MATTVTLDGELDLLTTARTTDLLAAATLTTSDVVVDLRSVTFMDATGLAPLAHTACQVRRRGGRMTLVLADPRLERVLRLARLSDLFTVVRDGGDAGAYCQRHA
ncbi:anti-sigma factor antagonist [Streptomyces silvisoli]|uniref:Anti-sigma factor antagonist n=1 Tax=Streptomyces silvisoli TaxID=3034235 RepID=A0ABT5ZPL7_9ACTN|nr:anti-sigma factor antagonist [Streptomyces silvisoli]MDF3291767.1 anti-sigma factor antagonist [Streptomyces silvisoli]